MHYTHTQRAAAVPHGRPPVRTIVDPERSTLRDPRRWWLRQARSWLHQARLWRARFGGPCHDVALGWYLDALVRADRYRRWARELAPALVQLDELLEAAS